MKKNTKQFEKGWTQLSLKYREWQDLQVKGRMKMKKKRNKQGKQYFDFDFSRYQYYYSYPEDHIGLASPVVQKQFINHLLQRVTQNPSVKYSQTQYQNWQQLQNILKPLQLHQFLRDIGNQLDERITSLRIEKCLRIKRMKGLFGPQNQYQKSMIQLIQTQIRSLCHKKIRINNKYTEFGIPLQDRLKDMKSYLKSRNLDEYQFSDITKGDLMVLMRIRYVKQALSFNTNILINIIKKHLSRQQTKMYNKFLQKKGQSVYNKKQKILKLKRQMIDKVMLRVNQIEPNHFDDNADSKIKLQNLVQSLDYIKCFSQNIQQTLTQKICNNNFVTLKLNFDQSLYVPLNQLQIRQRLNERIKYYFNKTLVDEEIIRGTDEHICYKINNLCFLQLKVLWESYNYGHKKQQSSLFKIRSMMRKQLELVYSRHIDNLLNIRQHSIKVPTSQKWIPKLLFTYKPQSQKETIMEYQMKVQKRFKDPLTSAFINLFGINKQAVVRDQIQKYVRKSMEVSSKLYQYRRLYYLNTGGDEKSHIVNVLNKNISIKKSQEDRFMALYIKILNKQQPQEVIDFNYFRSYYMLIFLRCSQERYQVMQVLNAQLMCLIKAQSRIKLLWKKSKLPFQMSKQFIQRFIDPVQNTGENIFRFTIPEVNQSHNDLIFKQMYNEDADKDYLNWNAQIGIQVRRRRSDNPLLEGKCVIYEQTSQLLEQCLTRIQFLCSQTIRHRQMFLFQCKFTQIVDRLQLLLQFLQYEHKFQKSKLKVLDLYTEQIVRLTSASGIKLVYQQMSKIINYNKIVDLTQPHYGECYKIQTQCFQSKATILKLLIQKQSKFQQQFSKKVFNQYQHSNLGATQPQISSMYYSEQITIQHDHQVIQQAAQDQSQSISSDNESNLNGKFNAISQISSVVDAGSQYHLKTSFQEILSKNSVGKIKQENNKKQQIMNKKKQRVINDSLLGIIVPKTDTTHSKSQFYNFTYMATQIMKKIDEMMIEYFCYPSNQVKAIFLSQIVQILQNYSFQTYRNLIKPEQLTVCLNSGHKAINKFIQRAKNQQAMSGRTSAQHWLSVNSKVIQNIISAQTGDQIDEFRGLYICLNAVHINQINYKIKQIQRIQSLRHSEFKLFKKLTEQHSTDQINHSQCQLQSPSYFQKRIACPYKLVTDLKQSGQQATLSIGNYTQYFKAISAFDLSVNNLIQVFNDIFYYTLNDLQTLEGELKVMQKYQCCDKLFSSLLNIPGIQNRVNLRKKIQFISQFKKRLIPRQLSIQIAQVLQSCTRDIPKFIKNQYKVTIVNMANITYQFQNYMSQIMKSSILINMITEELRSQVRSRKQIKKLKKNSSLFPFVQKNLHIVLLPNQMLTNIFNEYREDPLKQKKMLKQVKLTINQQKLSVQRILDYVLGAGQQALRYIRDQCLKRRKDQLNGDPQKFKVPKYFQRHFPTNFQQHQTQLQLMMNSFMKDTQKLKNIITLNQWLHSQSLIFGCSLNQQQLMKYRKMLINPLLIFHVFWDNNLKYLIGPRQLSKLRTNYLDSKDVITAYKQQYLSYSHLKKVYKNFIQDLSQFQFDQQSTDTMLILYIGTKEFFNPTLQNWSFLSNFCDNFSFQTNTPVDLLCQFINDYCSNKGILKRRFFDFPHTKIHFNVNQLKHYLWSSNNKLRIQKISQTKRFIKQRLHQSKSLAYKQIKDQVVLPYFRNQKFLQILEFLKIDVRQHSLSLDDYRQNFDKYVHEGLAILNTKQLFIFNMTQKSIQLRGQLIRTKDQIMKIIMNNQFYMKIIREKFYQFTNCLIDNQLSLRKILLEDLHNQQVSRDQKILKQTINKILVPKVKLNPFLASPLKIQNHFFAGSIKLSFIDQFLNKLRNRAVMIQLAEGGTGYLLKVNQLDESVEVLCKSIIGFSEKQFSDRFRTVFDALDQMKQKNTRLVQQNNNYKAILKVMKEYESREIKTLLYEKLNDYLVSFYEHEKFYNVMINLFKTIESKMQNQINRKFKQKITFLQFQNKQLEGKLQSLKSDVSQIIKSNTNEVRDALFNSFKQKAQSVLNKHFIQQIPANQNYQVIQTQDSQILLKKLMMQKSFYELKIAKIEGNFNQKINCLQKKLLQQSKVHNLLIMEQQKNKSLAKQVRQLQKCSIQNELLKKQMNKKEQQQTMQKFRLIKINESLKGKLKRMQEQTQQQKSALHNKIQQITKSQSKNKSSISVQVSNSDNNRVKRKTFHIKTQSSVSPNLLDVGVWKQKWVRSQKKFQSLIQSVKKVHQHFIFTKNGAKLTQNLKNIINQFDYKIKPSSQLRTN